MNQGKNIHYESSDPYRDRKGEDISDEFPLAYHIMIRCYGTRLHGDETGTVHHSDNIPGTPMIPHKPGLVEYGQSIMDQLPYVMDAPRRRIVLDTIKEVCKHRKWDLIAAHIRENHMHMVIQASCPPEKVMNDLKSYASQNLNKAGYDSNDRKRWARHGSTKYKWNEQAVEAAVDYVIREQGEPMEYYEK
jgi:REP element-mobilizing transposase RayT